jgi:hypothetical protein
MLNADPNDEVAFYRGRIGRELPDGNQPRDLLRGRRGSHSVGLEKVKACSDRTEVTRTAPRNVASIASHMLTAEAMIGGIVEELVGA